MKNFYLIGLTGNLGSGKSTVRKMLETLGARGIDADALAHVVMQRGTPTWRAVVEAFGADILAFNGRIDRRKLGQRVFANADSLRKLEAIVHPAVGALIKQMLRESPEPVVVIEAIKLIEAGMHLWCDALWVVRCAPEAQIERVMRDRHLSEADARARLAAQSPLEDKLRLAHTVIENSGNEAATRAEVEQAWRAIRPETARDKSDWLLGIPLRKVPSTASNAIGETTSAKATTAQSPAVAPPAPAWTTSQPPAHSEPAEAAALAPQPVFERVQVGKSAPQLPAWARVDADVEVRRARRSDLVALSVAIAKLENRTNPLARAEALQRLGERGYRIAIKDHRIVGLAAWEAENLVAIVREIWAESADAAPVVFPKLIALIEEEAKELLCEVVLLLIGESAMTLAAEAHAFGYEQSELSALHSVWQGVVKERLQPTDQIWLKLLRPSITTKPV